MIARSPHISAITATCALCLVSAPAHAQLAPQTPTGSRIQVNPQKVDPVAAGRIRKQFGQCVYRNNLVKVERILNNSDPQTIDYRAAQISQPKLAEALGLDDCLTDQIAANQSALSVSLKSEALRGLFLEEAYLAKFSKAAPQFEGRVETISRNYVSSGDDLRKARAFGTYSDCLIVKNPSGADAMLRTMPGSKDEVAAARALAPTLGACLVQGQQLAMTPFSIRTFAADGLWTRYIRDAGPAKAAVK